MELQARFDSIGNSTSNDILAKILIRITESGYQNLHYQDFFPKISNILLKITSIVSHSLLELVILSGILNH